MKLLKSASLVVLSLVALTLQGSTPVNAWTEPMNTSCRDDYTSLSLDLVSAYNANTTGFQLTNTTSFIVYQQISSGNWYVAALESVQIVKSTFSGSPDEHMYRPYPNYAHVMTFGVTGTYQSQTDTDAAQAHATSQTHCVAFEYNTPTDTVFPYTGSETIPQYTGFGGSSPSPSPSPSPTPDFLLSNNLNPNLLTDEQLISASEQQILGALYRLFVAFITLFFAINTLIIVFLFVLWFYPKWWGRKSRSEA